MYFTLHIGWHFEVLTCDDGRCTQCAKCCCAQKSKSSREASPVKLRRSSLTCSPADDPGDEGFLDLRDEDEATPCAISGLDRLLNAPVLGDSDASKKQCEVKLTSSSKPSSARHLQPQLDDSFEMLRKPKVCGVVLKCARDKAILQGLMKGGRGMTSLCDKKCTID